MTICCDKAKELGINAMIEDKLVKLTQNMSQRITVCPYCNVVLEVQTVTLFDHYVLSS